MTARAAGGQIRQTCLRSSRAAVRYVPGFRSREVPTLGASGFAPSGAVWVPVTPEATQVTPTFPVGSSSGLVALQLSRSRDPACGLLRVALGFLITTGRVLWALPPALGGCQTMLSVPPPLLRCPLGGLWEAQLLCR